MTFKIYDICGQVYVTNEIDVMIPLYIKLKRIYLYKNAFHTLYQENNFVLPSIVYCSLELKLKRRNRNQKRSCNWSDLKRQIPTLMDKVFFSLF